MKTTKIAIFRKKEIRKTIYNNEWRFVIEDVVLALIDSSNPKQRFSWPSFQTTPLCPLLTQGGDKLS